MGVPGQIFPSPRLLGISVDRCRGNALSEPVQQGFKVLDFLPNIFELLRTPVSVVHDSRPVDQYLIMLDKCVHPAEGGLEGRKPISGLFRDVKEYFGAICDSLVLC